jgi:hypothetical protein
MGGRISFFHAWQFGVLLYFFAALVVSLAHYSFYRFIASPEYIESLTNGVADILKRINMNPEETLANTPAFTPINLTIQGIFNNVFYGIILSIPVAAFACRNSSSTGTVPPQNQ